MTSAAFGQASCLQLLVREPGIRVNQEDADGFTPLMTATMFGHHQCVAALLRRPDGGVNLG